LLHLVASRRYKGSMHAIVQDEDDGQAIPLNAGLSAVVEFTKPYRPDSPVGQGMIVQLGDGDFLVAGARFRLSFRELEGPPREAPILSLEEGTFEGERWVPVRRLNGDELDVSFFEKPRVQRVRLMTGP